MPASSDASRRWAATLPTSCCSSTRRARPMFGCSARALAPAQGAGRPAVRRTGAWLGGGALALAVWSAVASRFAPGHVAGEAVVIVAAFTALRREPIPAAVTALALGYLEGRQIAAPLGAC